MSMNAPFARIRCWTEGNRDRNEAYAHTPINSPGRSSRVRQQILPQSAGGNVRVFFALHTYDLLTSGV